MQAADRTLWLWGMVSFAQRHVTTLQNESGTSGQCSTGVPICAVHAHRAEAILPITESLGPQFTHVSLVLCGNKENPRTREANSHRPSTIRLRMPLSVVNSKGSVGPPAALHSAWGMFTVVADAPVRFDLRATRELQNLARGSESTNINGQ